MVISAGDSTSRPRRAGSISIATTQLDHRGSNRKYGPRSGRPRLQRDPRFQCHLAPGQYSTPDQFPFDVIPGWSSHCEGSDSLRQRRPGCHPPLRRRFIRSGEQWTSERGPACGQRTVRTALSPRSVQPCATMITSSFLGEREHVAAPEAGRSAPRSPSPPCAQPLGHKMGPKPLSGCEGWLLRPHWSRFRLR